MLPLLLMPAAAAHVPHNIIQAVAVPTDLDPAEPWFAVFDANGASGLYRSTDGGLIWEAIGGAYQPDYISDAAMTREDTLVLLGDERYWYSDDGGETFAEAELPAAATAIEAGTALFISTGDGVFKGNPGGKLDHELEGVAIERLFARTGAAMAIAEDDSVWWRTGAGWIDLGSPARMTCRAGVPLPDAVYVGCDDGTVYRWDGDAWTAPCATVPYDDGEHGEIVRLATDEDRLLVTRAAAGPAYSDDDCVSWKRAISPMEIDFDAGSSRTDTDGAFTAMSVSGDAFVLAGYDGTATTYDAGVGWHVGGITPPDHARGIAFSEAFDAGDRWVYIGTMAGGIVRSDDGGATFDAPNIGVANTNIQDIAVPPDAPANAPLYALAQRVLLRSDDGGETWQTPTTPFSRMRRMTVGSDDRIWALDITSDDDYPGNFSFSPDGGESWERVELDEPLATSSVMGLLDASPLLCLRTEEHAACSSDSGESWTILHESTEIADAVWYPLDAPTTLLLTDTEGVWTIPLDGGAGTLTANTGGVVPRAIAAADDGTIWYADRGANIYMSEDGGQTWSDSVAKVHSPIAELHPRPDFGCTRELIVATSDGLFLYDGANVARFGGFQRLEAGSPFIECAKCQTIIDESVSLQRISELSAGASALTRVRGDSIRVLGEVTKDGSLRVIIDDVETRHALSKGAKGSKGAVFEVEGLAGGWHKLELHVDSGVVLLDAIEANGEGVAFSVYDGEACADTGGGTGDSGSGGSGSGGGSSSGGDSGGGESGGDGAADSGPGAGIADDETKKGCGCAGVGAPAGALPVLALLAVGRRRRR